jgi:hypothetical protein
MSHESPLLSESLVGLAELARRIRSPRRNGYLTPQAIWRWVTKGVRLRDGRVVRLEALRLAGRFVTSSQALERFIAAQNESSFPTETWDPPRTLLERQREAERIGKALDTAGI